MLMLWVSLPASAFEVDGIAYQIESDNEVSVTSKSERYSGSISIPSSVTYKDKIYNVTSIGLQAFMNSINLSAITIPATVSQIGKAAFARCKNLIYISLPDLIQSIPDQCFFECSNLENIRLPQHLISIKEHAFAFCEALRTIDLPNSVQEIGKAAFSHCNTLRTMDLPNSLQEVGERAFYGCELLNDISIPASITNIPAECFQGCINLTNVELHNGIKKVGHHAFCTRDYIYLHLPPSVEYIDQYIIDYGGIVLYRGNVMLDQQSGIDIAVLDSAFPTIIEKGDAHLFLVNPESFLSSNNYSSSKVSSIGKYGDNESEKIFWYDGTPQALRKGLFDNPELQEMGIEWYCKDFDVKDVGNYSGNAVVEVKHNDWSNTFPVSYAFEILKAQLTVRVNDCEKIYGDENPLFTFETNGLVENDNVDNSILNPIFSTSATNDSEVGNYSIDFSAESNNYNIKVVQGNLKVKQAPLIVQLDNFSRQYGDNNPEFLMSFEGLKLNDTGNNVFSTQPVLSCKATVTSDVGEYPIVATGGASKNYEITAYKSGVLSITKAPITLKAKDASRIYGDENPEFDFSLSGLKNSDDISCISTKPTYTCLSTTTSDCGEYDIVPANAQAKNYEISYLKGTLTVTQAPLILAASNLSREYGDSNPIFVYEAVGLKDNDTAETAIMEEPILSTTANEYSGVGQYPISVTGGLAKNYSLSYKSGVLTVTKAPLSVIAENAEREYGESNPIFSRSYSGLKLNDSEATVFSSLPALSCTATKSSDVGEYPIIVNGGISRNYEIVSYEKGVLKVKKAPLTLTAIDKSRLYFEDNPRFDYKLTGLRNSDSKNCLSTQPSFKCSAIKTSNVGDYEIMPADALAKNYAIDYKAGILSINKRALTAGIGNYTKIYGTENPKFEIEYSGFVNNEDKSVITKIPDVVCPANQSSDVGSYPISLEGGDAQNYVINKYNSGTLVINKADQILKWEQDLSDIPMNSQIALEASSDSGLPVSYEMSPNNVATLYNNNGIWYLDCYGSGAVNIRAVQNGDKNHNAASMISKTLVVNGSGGDPSNPQIFLNVENAGALSSLIATNRKYQIKNLRLTGYLNGTDINFIREMAGSDSYGNGTPGVLETLDISGCTIVSGGMSYYKSCRTSNNRVSDYMFYNCKQLVNLMLPDNTSIIDDYAFADCDRLSVISIPNEVTSFGLQSFRNDISLLRIPMPKGLKSIKDYAFIGCNGITELTIPAKVTQIGDGIVRDCQNISKINVAEGNDNFASQNGVLYSSNYNELLIFPVNYESDSYSVIDGTKRIAPYAFVNSKKLSKVILPATLTSIGTDAFIGCVNLTSLQVQAITPPVCDNDCFEAVSKTRCELIVPKGCYSYYWVAPVWSDFNKIREADAGADVKVISISLSDAKDTFILGEEVTLHAIVEPDNAVNKKLSYSSSDSNVVSCNDEGKLKAVGLGAATITISACDGSGVTLEHNVRVVQEVGFKNIYNTVTYMDMDISNYDNYFNYIPEITGPFSEDDFWIELLFLDKDNTYPSSQHVLTIAGGDYAGNYVNTNIDRPMYAGKYIFKLTPKRENLNVVANPSQAYLTVNKTANNLEWDADSPISVKVGEKVDLGIAYRADQWCDFVTDYDNELIELSSYDENGMTPHWYATGLKEGETYMSFRITCDKNDMGFYNFSDSQTESKWIKVEPSSGIEGVETDNGNISVRTKNGTIFIYNKPENSIVRVFNLQGSLIKETEDAEVKNLAKGMYVITVEDRSFKVML